MLKIKCKSICHCIMCVCVWFVFGMYCMSIFTIQSARSRSVYVCVCDGSIPKKRNVLYFNFVDLRKWENQWLFHALEGGQNVKPQFKIAWRWNGRWAQESQSWKDGDTNQTNGECKTIIIRGARGKRPRILWRWKRIDNSGTLFGKCYSFHIRWAYRTFLGI